MLNFPDFRAFERSYQLMSQVSGRAGRKSKRGKVIIQTFNPYHAIIRNVIDGDYVGMYKDQILDRRNFKYPPFYRLIKLTLKYKEAEFLNQGADKLAKILRNTFGNRVLGPEYPLVARVKNEYLKQLIIKLEKGHNLHKMKEKLREELQEFSNLPEYKRIKLVIDVDPL
jgi:primosomal protein N' (replication factor Y)